MERERYFFYDDQPPEMTLDDDINLTIRPCTLDPVGDGLGVLTDV